MNRDWYKPLTWLMWLALPTTGLSYWLVWDRLPYRMVVHFDANFHPNGYTSREGALELGLGIMGFILITSTIVVLAVRAMKPSVAWPVLAVSYVVLGFVTYGNYSILKFNLNRLELHPPPVNMSVPQG